MNHERRAFNTRPTEDSIHGADPEPIDGYYDRDIVTFLVQLGDVWIADDDYVSLRRHTGWTESWGDVTLTVPDHYTIELNKSDHEGRFLNLFWEDLGVAAHSQEEAADAGGLTDDGDAVMVGELWWTHRTLRSALDMIERILAHPSRFSCGREWVGVLHSRL